MNKLSNTAAKRFFGLHFYPGVAQYQDDPSQDPYRVFLNEDTLRKMDPSFQGKPIFVDHVNEVDPNIDILKKEVDGWVLKSFYNETDGKHWVEFLICSERGERAVRSGMRLSNAYIPKSFKDGGLWNGVPYLKEITDAEYEHLAIVENPRYEESVIMTPDEFKQYNENKSQELKKVANSKGAKMKFNFFKKTSVENAIDPELVLMLPKSGRSISLSKLINDAYEKDQDPAMEKHDEKEPESEKSHSMADENHMMKIHDGSYMKVKDAMHKMKSMMDELEDLKSKKKDSKEEELDLKVDPSGVDAEGDLHNDEEEEKASEEKKKEMNDEEMDDSLEHPEEPVHDAEDPEEDKEAKKKALSLAEHEQKEIEEAKQKNKKKNEAERAAAKAKADRLKNAHLRADALMNEQPQVIELSEDRVSRGKVRYGSN